MNEEKLELLYIYALEAKCPLETNKSLSIGGYARKGLIGQPVRFEQLAYYSQMLFNYIKSKTNEVNKYDCDDYVAWKIWQHKLEDIKSRIVNNYCRCKAQTSNPQYIKEVHKSASRLKRYDQKINQLLDGCNDSLEINQGLQEIKEELKINTGITLKNYNLLLEINHQVSQQFNQLIEQEIKQIKQSKDA